MSLSSIPTGIGQGKYRLAFFFLYRPASGIVPFATLEIGKWHDEYTGPVNPLWSPSPGNWHVEYLHHQVYIKNIHDDGYHFYHQVDSCIACSGNGVEAYRRHWHHQDGHRNNPQYRDGHGQKCQIIIKKAENFPGEELNRDENNQRWSSAEHGNPTYQYHHPFAQSLPNKVRYHCAGGSCKCPDENTIKAK